MRGKDGKWESIVGWGREGSLGEEKKGRRWEGLERGDGRVGYVR